MKRREFLSGMCASALAGGLWAETGKYTVPKGVKTRSALLHLGMNMWGGYRDPSEPRSPSLKYTHDVCPTETAVWNAVIDRMHARHYNHAIIDLGGGVELPSHPELTIKGSWSAQRLKDEVKRLSDMGIEAIPKLNFSTCHDAWLGKYERMVSTQKYYEVVRDVIADACEIFGNPRQFHIGMDEEDYDHQKRFPSATIRNGDLWWHDFNFYLACLEKHGARPISFSSTVVKHPDSLKRMPKSVLLNLGVYGHGHTLESLKAQCAKNPTPVVRDAYACMRAFNLFSKNGYDILTCCSNWVLKDKKVWGDPIPTGKNFPQDPLSIGWLHDFIAREMQDLSHLEGGMVAPWEAMRADRLDHWLAGIDQLADAMDAHGWKS